jgi:uncharacterized DUF497 family protein
VIPTTLPFPGIQKSHLKKTLVFSNLSPTLRVVFDFDPDKSKSNQTKHGIDFETAQELWLDPSRIELEARSDGEPRRAIVARIGRKTWFAVFTLRGAKIRLISVRRARRKEEAIYEEDDQQGDQH